MILREGRDDLTLKTILPPQKGNGTVRREALNLGIELYLDLIRPRPAQGFGKFPISLEQRIIGRAREEDQHLLGSEGPCQSRWDFLPVEPAEKVKFRINV